MIKHKPGINEQRRFMTIRNLINKEYGSILKNRSDRINSRLD